MSVDTIDEVDIGESISISKESVEHIDESSKAELGEVISEGTQVEEQEQEQEHVEKQEHERVEEQKSVQDVEAEEVQEITQEQAQEDTLAPERLTEREQALQQREELTDIVPNTPDPSVQPEAEELTDIVSSATYPEVQPEVQPEAEEAEDKDETSGQPVLDGGDLGEDIVAGQTDIPKIEVDESNAPLAPQIKVILANQTLTREEKVDAIKKLRKDITSLVSNIRNTKKLCDKYKNENQYLQEYVGSMMATGEMK